MSKPVPQAVPVSLFDYEVKALLTNQFQQDESGFQKIVFGYFGEIGGLLSALKKSVRDKLASTETELAGEELGDALWYLVNVAGFLKVDANSMGDQCIRLLRTKYGESEQDPVHPVTFRHIDSLMEIRRVPASISRSFQLGNLAYHAGAMAKTTLSEYQLMSPQARAQGMGLHLAELAIACASFDLRLEDVARSNLAKIHSRWPGEEGKYPNPFDADYPQHEQFPPTLEITFIERGTREKGHVVQSLNGVFIGDRLTDNSNEPDDYRFHDVFHLAYLAFLGWSPVLRGLLKRKRKSNSRTDENEDGARAMIIEEGIATWIFNHANHQSSYADDRQRGLDYGVLKQICSMVQGYEVEKCQIWQWEKAIVAGFEIFRKLQENRGGTVVVDVLKHTMDFIPPIKN
ncbi:nucleoside triphosphate pyrophosphohydrolase family protein [Pseudomonas sp. MLB6B]